MHPPAPAQDDRRVLKFRPRSSDALRDDDAFVPAEPDAPEEFKHRMWINAVAFAVTVALTASGIWLAVRMADLRNTQDCVLMGRRDCAYLATSPAAATATEPAVRRH